jgi:cytochrome c biogenesis protein CcdA
MAGKYKNIVRGVLLFFGGFIVMGIGTLLPQEWKILYFSMGGAITFMGATVIGFLMTNST